MDGSVTFLERSGGGWFVFSNPLRILVAYSADEVAGLVREIEEATLQDLYAVGFVSYEAASSFDSALVTQPAGALPLARFTVHDAITPVDVLPEADASCDVGDWVPDIAAADYSATIDRIRGYISAGDTYQVNFTIRLHARAEGDPYALFRRLALAQRGGHAAFIQWESHAICCASPELFFRTDGNRLVSRPMKGTASREPAYEEDRAAREALARSEKNRAENIMIVDMIRNDMGRIADSGSVEVTGEFDVESFPTVHQMTSTVESDCSAGISEILGAMFPCASITGAPKVRTMQIIRDLESSPRGVYCGTIGYAGPGGTADFNVAIRTVVVDRSTGAAEYGVGGGIVWDSSAGGELDECLHKARVLTAEVPEFELLETMLWLPDDGYYLMDLHMVRMARSAEYFGFSFKTSVAVSACLTGAESFVADAGAMRVRLLAARDGAVRLESFSIDVSEPNRPMRVALSPDPVSSTDVYLHHKTTHRAVYEQARELRPDCDDVLLCNERGEVTEATIANVVAVVDGKHLTPAASCGLLPGIMRERLLEIGEIEEAVLTPDDLHHADRLYLVNSVRRAVPCELVSV